MTDALKLAGMTDATGVGRDDSSRGGFQEKVNVRMVARTRGSRIKDLSAKKIQGRDDRCLKVGRDDSLQWSEERGDRGSSF
jgi:hypothetical protein